MKLKEAIGDFAGADTFASQTKYTGADFPFELNPATEEIKKKTEEELNKNLDDLGYQYGMYPIAGISRTTSDTLYRDLGNPNRVNAIVAPEEFVPKDPGKTLKLNKNNIRGPMIPGGVEPVEEAASYDKHWKETTMANRGQKLEGKPYNTLVSPKDFVEDLENQGDVKTSVLGSTGTLVSPKDFVGDGDKKLKKENVSDPDLRVHGPVNSFDPWATGRGKEGKGGNGDKKKILFDSIKELVKEAIEEEFASKAQQRLFWARASKPGKEGKKWKKWAKEWSADTDFSGLPERSKK